MNHQIQGLTLVNNEWVSRPLDIYQIMARARQDDVEPQEATLKSLAQAPDYGILSRTLLASPLTKYVLPANIRRKDLIDIVFIGEESVQLKEICEYGHLRHVATKADFRGARIIAAKVFGQPREVLARKHVSSPLSKMPAMRGTGRPVPGDEEHVLPPELVVLTLSTRTLMFLWARQHQKGGVTFAQRTVKLPAGNSRFDRFGAFLAVDPKCRAMAVAAQEGRLILYKTKSIDAWRSDLSSGVGSLPIEDERVIPFEGRVMHMDFLSSSNQLDESHVVLLLILVHHGKTKITCFDWDCRQNLDKAAARTERIAVDFDDCNPSLLIPMRRSLNFLLISDTHISIYKDVLSGTYTRERIPISANILSPINPGDSKRKPQWIAWDSAPRNPDFTMDVFYIAREDGRMIYAACGPGLYAEISEVGNWPHRIDTGFACVSVDNSEFSQSYPDVLIAAGAGNDGLVCRVGSWPTEYSYSTQYPDTNSLTFVESVPDWTPLTDLSITRLSGSRAGGERDRCTMFASNGNAPNGRISEIRYGLQALVDDSISGLNGTTGLWVLDYGSQTLNLEGRHQRQHYVTFMLNLPPESLVIRVVRTQPEATGNFFGAWESGFWDKYQVPSGDEPINDGLMRDRETLSACAWSERHSIQIGQSEARILYRPSMRQKASICFEEPLLLANSRPGTPFIVATYRDLGDTFLEIIHITHDILFHRRKESRYHLPYDPTCLEIFSVDGVAYVFVCTFDAKITLLHVDETGNMSPLIVETLENTVRDGERSLLESAVILSSHGRHMLVCTTRDGWLLSTEIVLEASAPSRTWSSLQMGPNSARVSQCSTDTSTAFVSCGADFCRVRCDFVTQALSIHSIWFTSHTIPRFMQSAVTATCQLPYYKGLTNMERNLGGFLFTVAGEQLLFSRLGSDVDQTGEKHLTLHKTDTGAVIRSISTSARPTSILYLKSQRKLLVATIEAKEERLPPNGSRILQSTLKLLKAYESKLLDEVEVKQEDGSSSADDLPIAEYQLEHAERVYTMVDWQFDTHHGKRYSLLIVGTGIQTGTGKAKGRRLIFSLGKSSKFSLQKESTYDQPVYCVAMWDNSSTVTSIGNVVSLDSFDSQAGRWTRLASLGLPSPGIYISVKPPFVYISTLSHSHLCYEIQERQGSHHFEPVFSDIRERSCTHHLVLDVPHERTEGGYDRMVLFTDKKSATVAGLYHPPEKMCKTASTTIFEACLPRTVVRLQRGDIRPPWRRIYTREKKDVIIPSGVLIDDIVGACSDGTFYTFSVLSESAHHLLRMLQNLLEAKRSRDTTMQDTTIKQRSGHILEVLMNGAEGAQDGCIRAHDIDPGHQGRGIGTARNKHVDGDLIVKWLNENGDLQELVTIGTDCNMEPLFRKLAQALDNDTMGSNDEQSEPAEVVYSRARRWLSQVFMPVL